MRILVIFIMCISVCSSLAYGNTHQQRAVGLWYTHPTSRGTVDVVEIFEENGKLYGYGFSSKNPEDNIIAYDVHNPNPHLRNQQLTGLIFIYDVAPVQGKEISKGYIYDPENGSTYHLQIRMKDNNTLILRPTLDSRGVLGPNIEWKRVDTPEKYTPLPHYQLHKPYKE